MARRVSLRTRVVAAVSGASIVAGGLVLLATPSASAQSIRQIKAQIASTRAQLRKLNNQAETASERYDAARIALGAAQLRAAAASKRLASTQAQVARAQRAAASFAVAAYTGDANNSLTAVIAGSTRTLLARDDTLEAISTTQSAALVRIAAAKRAEEQAQVDATAALAQQRRATTAMAAQRTRVLAAAGKEQQILKGLQTKEAELIRAAKARAARIAARRAAAALAVKRAAAAAAARAVQKQTVTQPVPVPAPASPPHHSPQVSGSGGAATAVAWAYREIGKPYVWGAAGPNSFDCSGLAQYVWGKAGVYLQHYTGAQWHEGTHVDRSQLEPGDLVFFAYNTSDPSTIHHVGIYIGGGEMIDAPYTGVDVRKDPAFRSDYIGAVRP